MPLPSIPSRQSHSKSRSPTPTNKSPNSQQEHSVTPERKFGELTPVSSNIPPDDPPSLSKGKSQDSNGLKGSPQPGQVSPKASQRSKVSPKQQSKSGTTRQKQQTLTSLFSAKTHTPDKGLALQHEEAVPDSSLPPQVTPVPPKLTTPPPQLTPMDKDEGVLTFELPLKQRSEVAEFEERLNRHMKANPVAKVAPKAVKPGGVASALSKTATAKRNEAPGMLADRYVS